MRSFFLKVSLSVVAILILSGSGYAALLLGCQAAPAFCTLGELMRGGSIQIGDKIFRRWSFILDAQFPINPEKVQVKPLEDGGADPGPGLLFDNLFPSGFSVAPGQNQETFITYDVQTFSGQKTIKDSTLDLTASGQGTPTAIVSIKEELLPPVNMTNTTSAPGALHDRKDFNPTDKVSVFTTITLDGGRGPGGNTFLNLFDERFSQTVRVSEPSSMVLFATTMGALLLAGEKRFKLH